MKIRKVIGEDILSIQCLYRELDEHHVRLLGISMLRAILAALVLAVVIGCNGDTNRNEGPSLPKTVTSRPSDTASQAGKQERRENDALAYFKQGNAHREAHRYREAIAAYKKAIALKRDFAEAYYNMGVSYDHRGGITEAIAAYKKAIAIKPDYAEAYLRMGMVHEQLEQDAEALAALRKFIALEPTGTDADFAREIISRIENYIENRDKP